MNFPPINEQVRLCFFKIAQRSGPKSILMEFLLGLHLAFSDKIISNNYSFFPKVCKKALPKYFFSNDPHLIVNPKIRTSDFMAGSTI